MRYSIKSGSPAKIRTDCVVTIVWSKGVLSAEAELIDAATDGYLSRIVQSKDFTGKLRQTHLIHAPVGLPAKRLLLVGGGDPGKFSARNATTILHSALQVVGKLQGASAHFAVDSLDLPQRDKTWFAARLAQEAETAGYRYDTTKSRKARSSALKSISLGASARRTGRKPLEAALKNGQIIGQAVNYARELGNLPGNLCTPTWLAGQARDLAATHRTVTTRVLGEKQMATLGMGSLLSVAAGSAEEARLIVMRYKGAPSASRPHVLVGKGITFDTGGISLKPGAAMDEMKFDMCGAASVLATLKAVAELKLPVNVISIIAAAENMPGSKATKPGDVVTSLSGKTIEILNTDAEGRLVLCDAITYAERFKPRSLIDVATLTGAAVATFGSHANVLLSNDDDLARELLDCGEQALDRAWQLPLWDDYQRQLDSNFADIANIGGLRAGTITAACFLSRFTEKQRWAHLDIAGSAWHSGKAKGATGRPVSLLVEYLRRQQA